MSDEMEKELRKIKEQRDFFNEVWKNQKQGLRDMMQSQLDIEEAKIKAKYGQLTPSEERSVQQKMEDALRKNREHYASRLGESMSLYKDEIEEEQRDIREQYTLPEPVSKPQEPLYSPPLSSSIEPPLPLHIPSPPSPRKRTMGTSMEIECPDCGAINEVEVDSPDELADLECEECGSPLFDEEDEDEDSDEEEDYVDKPPAFVFTPSAPASTPGYQEPERYQPEGGKSRLGKRLVRDFQTGEYIQTRDYVDIPQATRRQGLYIIGIQGYGKSGLIENLIVQDIKQNTGVCVLDPHGELIDHVIARLPDREKEEKVILLDIADYHYAFGLNLLECPDLTDPTEVRRTVDQVLHVFEKAYGISELTPLMYDLLYHCVQTLIVNPGYTMIDIPLLLTNEACRKKLAHNVTRPDIRAFWERWDDPKLKSPREQQADSQTILNKFNDFSDAPLRNLVGQSRSTINLVQIMEERKILLVKLDPTLDKATSLLGSILIALILRAAYDRPSQKQFHLYADEFQRFATEDFAKLLEEARKFGIGTTIAHQNRSQLNAKNKDLETDLKDRTRSAANMVVFRINRKDADDLAGEFAQEPEAASVEEIEPVRHQRIEEQITDEVEEDIEEITQKPVAYLVSARGTHRNAQVREAMQTLLDNLGEKSAAMFLIDKLLLEVMEGRVKLGTEGFVKRVHTIAQNFFYVAYSSFEFQNGVPREFADCDEKLLAFIHAVIRSGKTNESAKKELLEATLELEFARDVYRMGQTSFSPGRLDPEGKREYRIMEGRKLPNEEIVQFRNAWLRDHATLYEQQTDKLTVVTPALVALCEGLAADPIRVPTGQKRMVKRTRTVPTWLTDPPKNIPHPRRLEQDMIGEMARKLTKLPLYTARAKVTTRAGLEELTIRTLEPERRLGRTALQERIARIQEHNRTPEKPGSLPYCRARQEVEEEIRIRQEQCSQPPQEPPKEPPVTRRQPK